jgi:hypothetical protein
MSRLIEASCSFVTGTLVSTGAVSRLMETTCSFVTGLCFFDVRAIVMPPDLCDRPDDDDSSIGVFAGELDRKRTTNLAVYHI